MKVERMWPERYIPMAGIQKSSASYILLGRTLWSQMTSMKKISGMVAERQLSMFGHVARLSTEDPVRRVISCSDPSGWKRRPGRPHRTWLRQMDDYCQRVGTDRVSAWVLARGDPKAYKDLGRDVAKHPHDGASSSQ